MAEPPGRPDQRIGWYLHDAAIGGAAGLAVGFVVGVFVMARLVESLAFPFVLGAAGAIAGGVLLVRAGRDRGGITVSRLVAWMLFGAGSGFLFLLYRALDEFG